jgi:pimeloyl-ACP methyl ester carboxylesterase
MHVELPSRIRIEYEATGDPSAPVILLIMGLGMQLIAWPPPLVNGLAARGFRVLRFDNRDIGLSTHVHTSRPVDMRLALGRAMIGLPVRPPYTLQDMAGDAVGLLDALHIDRAHVVGVSMGGMIAQLVASGWAARTRSLTSIMSSSGRVRFRYHFTPATRAMLAPPPPGANEEQLLAHMSRVWHAIGSADYPPEPEAMRERFRASLRRSFNPAGVGRQLLAIMADGDRRARLRRITSPTLVLHGERDQLVPIEAGRDTAQNIPGAVFRSIPKMAHDLPLALVPLLVDEIASHCERARG